MKRTWLEMFRHPPLIPNPFSFVTHKSKRLGVPDDDYYGGGGPGSTGVDAGQQSLLSGGEMMSDEMKAGDGPGLGDGQTVWCGCMSIRFYQQVRGGVACAECATHVEGMCVWLWGGTFFFCC